MEGANFCAIVGCKPHAFHLQQPEGVAIALGAQLVSRLTSKHITQPMYVTVSRKTNNGSRAVVSYLVGHVLPLVSIGQRTGKWRRVGSFFITVRLRCKEMAIHLLLSTFLVFLFKTHSGLSLKACHVCCLKFR